MKRNVTFLVAIVLLFCASYAAAQSVTLNIGNRTGSVGQQVCVPFTAVSGFNALLGLQTSIRYDPSALRPVSLQNINLPGIAADNFSIIIPGVNGTGIPGAIILAWQANSVTAGQTVANGTVLFEICFEIIDGSLTSTPISFSDSPRQTEAFDSNEDPVTFNGQPGTVTIQGGGSGAKVFRLRASNKTVTQGQQVCVDITGENFDSIGTTRYTIQYDNSRLQFASVGSFNLPGLTNASFGFPGSNGVPVGRLTVNWTNSPASAAGVTRANGAVLFQVCFTATATGSASVSFTNSPQAQVITKGNGNAVTFNGQSGTVTVNGTGGGGNSNVFRLIMSDTTSPSGTTVCLDVKSQGFNNIASMTFSMLFDQTRLQFVSTGQYNASLDGLGEQSFGRPGVGGVPQGRITMVWDDAGAANGTTLPDGTVLYEVCFRILATSGTAAVSFSSASSNPPILTEVLVTENGNVELGVFSGQSGTVTIGTGNGGGGETGFNIAISDKTVAPNQQVCLDVTVKNFIEMISMQFSFGYDPSKLQFVSVSNLNLQFLSAGKIGTPNSTQPTPVGQISVIWEDESLQGITVPDNRVIFQICFTAIGGNGPTTVSFTEIPTSIEITDTSFAAIPYTSRNGVVTIGSGCAAPTLAPPSITQVSCFGQSNGAVNITPQGGSGNFTYLWSNNATTRNLANIPAGLYSVTVTDATCNQSVSAQYNVSQPSSALAAVATITDVACGAAPNSGSIVLTTAGGTSPYRYAWSSPLTGTTSSQMNLAAGTYSVTVTDNRNCTFALTNLTVRNESTVQISSIVPTNINQQGNNGAVAVTASGGTGTFTYSWSGPNNYTSTQEDITGLSNAGQYCVTVTDSEGCTANRCVMVTAPFIVTGQTNRICSGASNGSITLTVTGGAAPYTYRWSNGATTQNLNNVSAGNYSVTVTDSQNATTVGNFEITTFPPIIVDAQVTNASNGANGRIVLNVSGGNSPYNYDWENAATTSTVNNLAAGEYCVTITDGRGCTSENCFTVPQQTIPLAIANLQVSGLRCAGESNGTLSFEIIGGRAPYAINFSDNTSILNNNGTVSKSNLTGTSISFTVTDDAGTSLMQTVQIPQPTPIQISNLRVVHDSEESGCTGSITATFTGGKAPYFVQWNAPNTGTGTQIINLCEGNFIATVRDSNGCVQTLPAVTVNTFRANGTAVAATCPQDTSGMVALAISGGTQPYAYSWRNATGTVISTADTLRNVAPGVYTVRITEQSGNTLIKQFIVGATSNLNADVEVISDYNGSDISCREAKDAIIEASGRSGSGNYTFEWRRSTELLGTMPVLNGVGAGTYQVAVKDGLGCTVTKQVNVAPPDTLQIIANIRQISCVGRTDGEVIASAIGGASGRPYSFAWSTGVTGPRISFLTAGTYRVTATDANNCQVVSSIVMQEPAPLRVRVETQPATDNCNGSALAIVEGGTAPYTFKWNAPITNQDAMVDGLCTGSYSVAVADSRGCTASLATGIVGESGNPTCFVDKVVITPEGDGVNDDFRVACNDSANNHLEIYNRWGQLVFQADNYQSGWSGTTQSGDPLPEGPYYFVLEYDDSNNKRVQLKGSMTILRGE